MTATLIKLFSSKVRVLDVSPFQHNTTISYQIKYHTVKITIRYVSESTPIIKTKRDAKWSDRSNTCRYYLAERACFIFWRISTCKRSNKTIQCQIRPRAFLFVTSLFFKFFSPPRTNPTAIRGKDCRRRHRQWYVSAGLERRSTPDCHWILFLSIGQRFTALKYDTGWSSVPLDFM